MCCNSVGCPCLNKVFETSLVCSSEEWTVGDPKGGVEVWSLDVSAVATGWWYNPDVHSERRGRIATAPPLRRS